MTTDNIGKVFEAELEKVLRLLESEHLIAWHRFPDTHSAGGALIQPQPSDYLLGVPPGSRVAESEQRLVFVEAKASDKHKSLQKSAISPHQRGRAKVFYGMLHIPYLVLHYSTKTGCMEIWSGLSAVGPGRIDKKHFFREFKAGEGRNLNTRKTADELAAFLSLPEKKMTLKGMIDE